MMAMIIDGDDHNCDEVDDDTNVIIKVTYTYRKGLNTSSKNRETKITLPLT